jgi:branched-chain amino acid transport system substrate-binding protein
MTNDKHRVNRRNVLATTGIALTGTVAGCTGGNGGNGNGNGKGNGNGNGNGDTGGGEGPIQVGVLAAEDFAPSAAILRGAEHAVEQLNQNGGVLGREIELNHRDTRVDPQTTRRAYQELVVELDVPVTFGIMLSEALLSVLDLMAQHQSLLLNTGSATPRSSQNVAENYEQYKYYFRPGILSAAQYSDAMIDFAAYGQENWGWESVAVVAEDAAWSTAAYEAIQPIIEDSSLEGVNFQLIGTEVEDFTPIFDEIEDNDPDLTIPLAAYNAARMSVQWSRQERSFNLGGIMNELAPINAYENLDGDCRYAGVYATTHRDVNPTDKTEPFVERHQEMFGQLPGNFAYSTFDAVYIWAEAVEEAGTTNPDEVVPVIEDISYDGVMGTHQFEDNHNVVYDTDLIPQPIFQWQEQEGEGVQELVYPEDHATGDWIEPDWL